MVEISIPGYAELALRHLVLDYNGTLARDGELLAGVAEAIRELAASLRIHVVTGDTFGTARAALAGLPCEVLILPAQDQARRKRDYVEQLGAAHTVCIGNGRNDRMMLAVAALAVAVTQEEGAAAETLQEADVVCPDIRCAFELLRRPARLVATLRS
jgi:P-type E1-E2 ATPase